MKVTFVLPVLSLAGGIRIAALYADWLARHGHEVTVLYGRPREPSLREKLRSLRHGGGWSKPASNTAYFRGTKVRLIEASRSDVVMEAEIPDGDVVIATWWLTAEWVRGLDPRKGKKIYFLQGYEALEGTAKERMDATWRLPFQKIVVAKWLKEIAEKKFGDPTAVVVPNGVDLAQFHAAPRSRQGRPTVGLMYSPMPIKGCDIALKAVALARQRLPGLHLVAFGADSPTTVLPLPEDSEFHLRPPQDKLREIYGKCDAWLFASRTEGFGLPILEAMACRTPVIGTPAGAAQELLSDGRGVLVPHEDAEAMAAAIEDVMMMSDQRWATLSGAAFTEVLHHGLEEACRRFELALLDIAKAR